MDEGGRKLSLFTKKDIFGNSFALLLMSGMLTEKPCTCLVRRLKYFLGNKNPKKGEEEINQTNEI